MRIINHDYSGHPFQIQLSRALAGRGHEVTHLYSDANPTTPKGALRRQDDDAPTLSIEGINLPKPISKGAFFERWRLERLYGRRLAARVVAFDPQVVLLSNTPLDAAAAVQRVCRRQGIPVVFWLQDLIGEATGRILGARLGWAGVLIGQHYRRMERRLLRGSAHIVGITGDFAGEVAREGISATQYTTIPNWAPLDEIARVDKKNAWARQQGLSESFVFLYSGTLGFKHNPGLLLSLARYFADHANVNVVVNSEGDAADWLRKQAAEQGLSRLHVNPYQPYERMSDVLGAADVLVSILEPDAGAYSVPSKVLSYHCAGRAMLLAVPRKNLAARIVTEGRTGLVADPRDESAFLAAARRLYEGDSMRREMGQRARAYAERTFDIEEIADRFELVLGTAVAGK